MEKNCNWDYFPVRLVQSLYIYEITWKSWLWHVFSNFQALVTSLMGIQNIFPHWPCGDVNEWRCNTELVVLHCIHIVTYTLRCPGSNSSIDSVLFRFLSFYLQYIQFLVTQITQLHHKQQDLVFHTFNSPADINLKSPPASCFAIKYCSFSQLHHL